MTNIYYTFFDSKWSENDYLNAIKDLPVNEQNKNLKFIRWQDRQAGILGKLLIKYALKQFSIEKDISEIIFNKYGKPYFVSGPNFNISHSGRYIVCIISTQSEVGIDIEEIKLLDAINLKSILTNQELKLLEEHANNPYIFYDIWTKKEAVIKADGSGMSIPLTQINTVYNPVIYNNVAWHVQALKLDNNYQCNFASLHSVLSMHVQEVSCETLFLNKKCS